MRTWQEFVEAKAMLAPMSQQPPEYQAQPARRSATLALTPAQRIQGQQAYQTAGQPQTGPSDEEMGQQYAKSMNIQQQMARSRMGRGV